MFEWWNNYVHDIRFASEHPAWVDWAIITFGLLWLLCALYGIWSILRWVI